jgi:hypothetical protein
MAARGERRGGARRAGGLLAVLLALGAALAGKAAARPLLLATWDLDGLAAEPALPAAGEASPSGMPAATENGGEGSGGAKAEPPARFTFGSEGKDLDALARYAARLAPDVIALEGIASREAAARLFPPERYAFAFADVPPPFGLGFAVRRELTLTRHPDLAALDVYGPEAKWHLRAGADVTVAGPGLPPLRLLAVHLKAGCRRGLDAGGGRAACRVLSAQLEEIARWIAAREREGAAFAVLGDFNLEANGRDGLLTALGPGRELPGGGLLEPTARYASPCWGGEPFVDRIVLGGAARAWVVPGSLHVLVYRETERAARARLSSHCPVALRLDPEGKADPGNAGGEGTP